MKFSIIQDTHIHGDYWHQCLDLDKDDEQLYAIPGTPPNLKPPKGDAFALRSEYALKIDFEEEPPMFKVSDTHYAATWLIHPHAPKVNYLMQ